jgi:hypothetical protein
MASNGIQETDVTEDSTRAIRVLILWQVGRQRVRVRGAQAGLELGVELLGVGQVLLALRPVAVPSELSVRQQLVVAHAEPRGGGGAAPGFVPFPNPP